MLAIYLFHTEIYYTGDAIIHPRLYVENALSCFFFISGYLFYKNGTKLSFSRKVRSVIRHIIVPYFIFATVMAFPKAFVHDTGESATEVLLGVLAGQASWFITALAVAEIMFAAMLSLPEKYHAVIMPACAACYVVSFCLPDETANIWNFNTALMSLAFLYLGFIFHIYEERINKRNRWLLPAILPPPIGPEMVRTHQRPYGELQPGNRHVANDIPYRQPAFGTVNHNFFKILQQAALHKIRRTQQPYMVFPRRGIPIVHRYGLQIRRP